MDNLQTYSNLRRDKCTGEVCFKGCWMNEEEYFEIQNEEHNEKEDEACAEDEQQEESWAA